MRPSLYWFTVHYLRSGYVNTVAVLHMCRIQSVRAAEKKSVASWWATPTLPKSKVDMQRRQMWRGYYTPVKLNNHIQYMRVNPTRARLRCLSCRNFLFRSLSLLLQNSPRTFSHCSFLLLPLLPRVLTHRHVFTLCLAGGFPIDGTTSGFLWGSFQLTPLAQSCWSSSFGFLLTQTKGLSVESAHCAGQWHWCSVCACSLHKHVLVTVLSWVWMEWTLGGRRRRQRSSCHFRPVDQDCFTVLYKSSTFCH